MIRIPVDLTNAGQFFACCGLLELADRLYPGAEGWFEGHGFCIAAPDASFVATMQAVAESNVANTMTPAQIARLSELSNMKKKQRTDALEEEKKALESLRRELPIVLTGKIGFRIDWFCDEFAGGSRFKTWAGQQSVLDIAQAMHGGIKNHVEAETAALWTSTRGIGLPFNFDFRDRSVAAPLKQDLRAVIWACRGSSATARSRPHIEALFRKGCGHSPPRPSDVVRWRLYPPQPSVASSSNWGIGLRSRKPPFDG